MPDAPPPPAKPFHGGAWRNLPNQLTLARMAMVPIVVLCLYGVDPARLNRWDMFLSWMAAGLFILAAITDSIDGMLARRYNLITNLGKLLDPLADKLLVLAALVMLTVMDRVPAWMTILFLARESAITGLRGIAAQEGVAIAAGAGGKWKTVLQMIAIPMLIVHKPCGRLDFGLAGTWLLWAALAVAFQSAWVYFRAYSRHLA